VGPTDIYDFVPSPVSSRKEDWHVDNTAWAYRLTVPMAMDETVEKISDYERTKFVGAESSIA